METAFESQAWGRMEGIAEMFSELDGYSATDPRRHDRDFRLASEIAAGMFAAIATSIEKINAALAEAEQLARPFVDPRAIPTRHSLQLEP